MPKKKAPVPIPDKTESRICFGIAYFKSEDNANRFHDHVREQGDTKNGGWFHGTPCGRDTGFDYVDDELGQLYAVTTR